MRSMNRCAMTEITDALKQSLVPIVAGDDDAVSAAVADAIQQAGVPADDVAAAIVDHARLWEDSGTPSQLLRTAVNVCLSSSSDQRLVALSKNYFSIHEAIRGMGISFQATSSLIASAKLVADLAQRHRMSATQIATVLMARGPASTYPWPAIQKLLSAINLRPSLTDESRSAVLLSDQTHEEAMFVDARWDESLEIVRIVAERVGFDGDILNELGVLVPEDGDTHWPYVNALHLLLIPNAMFDHPPTFPYEFAPRGKWATEQLGALYAPLTAAGNSILNNLKAIDELGRWWSDSRIRSRGEATRARADAMVNVLRGLVGLPPTAKHELAELLRAWCLRQVRLFGGVFAPVPGPPNAEEAARVLTAVSGGNTQTRGVVEQRVVDALAAPRFLGWRPRGLLDSVNAANLPRRKLGDCEFQDASTQSVEAFEAHGGFLSEQYLQGHINGLQKIISKRIEEDWGDSAGWAVTITFVAHEAFSVEPQQLVIEDVPVTLRFTTFETLVGETDIDASIDSIAQFVWQPLNETRTPDFVRAWYLAAINA